ncbi:hypothetical protein [Zhengella mangrovi]|uniref:hypothetical protein n=1 Tax=Zhengella mangrovi TaxID=1982044 RepID=UPI0010562AEA|nr:hypothetical protein [Zhengella mangrovi]
MDLPDRTEQFFPVALVPPVSSAHFHDPGVIIVLIDDRPQDKPETRLLGACVFKALKEMRAVFRMVVLGETDQVHSPGRRRHSLQNAGIARKIGKTLVKIETPDAVFFKLGQDIKEIGVAQSDIAHRLGILPCRPDFDFQVVVPGTGIVAGHSAVQPRWLSQAS